MTGSLAIPAYIVASAILVGVYLLLARRRPWVGVALFLVVILGSAGVLSRTLGHAMPTEWELAPPGKAELIAFELQEGTAIYLWLRTPAGPKAYITEWNLDNARKLYEAGGLAERIGANVMVEGAFDESDGDFAAHPIPPEALPPKQESGS